jgi:hypothetical protein
MSVSTRRIAGETARLCRTPEGPECELSGVDGASLASMLWWDIR